MDHSYNARSNVDVLYIAGAGRSGSTLLGSIFGELESATFIGESRLLWSQASKNTLCGCGAALRDCSLWGEVLNHIEEHKHRRGIAWIKRVLGEAIRYRRIPQLLAGTLGRQPAFRHLGNTIRATYRAVHKATGSKLIVDSSSHPRYGLLLNAIPGIEMRVVHLVRDSRAVAHSNTRTKRRPEFEDEEWYLRKQSVPYTSCNWLMRNALAAQLRRKSSRSIFLKYEELTRNPKQAIEGSLARLKVEDECPAGLGERRVRFANGGAHTIAGNPVRFQGGTVRIRTDAKWRRKMSNRDKTLVTLTTAPLLATYGYDFW